jgi:hypothetical protein
MVREKCSKTLHSIQQKQTIWKKISLRSMLDRNIMVQEKFEALGLSTSEKRLEIL